MNTHSFFKDIYFRVSKKSATEIILFPRQNWEMTIFGTPNGFGDLMWNINYKLSQISAFFVWDPEAGPCFIDSFSYKLNLIYILQKTNSFSH